MFDIKSNKYYQNFLNHYQQLKHPNKSPKMPPAEDKEKRKPGSMRTSHKTSATEFNDPRTLVTFIVGPKNAQETFLVHKEVVCNNSPVFAAALNRNFIEGETLKYTLDDVEPATFKLLIQWMYSQKLSGIMQLKEGYTWPKARLLYEEEEEEDRDEDDNGNEEDNWDENDDKEIRRIVEENKRIIDLWLLGERFLMSALQNVVIDTLTMTRRRAKLCLLIWHYRYVYAKTERGSLLRKYFVEYSLRADPPLNRIRLNYSHTMPFNLFRLYKFGHQRDHVFCNKDFYVPVEGDAAVTGEDD